MNRLLPEVEVGLGRPSTVDIIDPVVVAFVAVAFVAVTFVAVAFVVVAFVVVMDSVVVMDGAVVALLRCVGVGITVKRVESVP